MNDRLHCQDGFTLIELLMVLMLMALTLTVITPGLFNTLASVEQKTVVQRISSDIARLGRGAFYNERELILDLEGSALTVWEKQATEPLRQYHYEGVEFEKKVLKISSSGLVEPEQITLQMDGVAHHIGLVAWR